jgi:hypothetical protein
MKSVKKLVKEIEKERALVVLGSKPLNDENVKKGVREELDSIFSSIPNSANVSEVSFRDVTEELGRSYDRRLLGVTKYKGLALPIIRSEKEYLYVRLKVNNHPVKIYIMGKEELAEHMNEIHKLAVYEELV